ncbi:hypothetical protein [Mucilaginibacter flavidus]|uniref:hypothetical protein n=1 Tax=Mucilaginibacter flavidus TaxID=2949309 RepID=UPI002093BDAA|nr:hypothetical protein [Mucilaginibacter flavidus]MCO5946233.1 hypothetical protein [Mucilaginibacter flavidus]
METPYGGRASIIENFDGIEIIVPAKRNTFVIIFFSIWLCIWTVSEFSTLNTFIIGRNSSRDIFSIVWLCGWTLGGLIAFRALFWTITGKEIIKVGQGALTINKRGALLYKAKSYDLREAKNFRAWQEYAPRGPFGNTGSNNAFNIANNGTIRFDYGMQTIKFADGLDEAEANFILQKLRDKKYIS